MDKFQTLTSKVIPLNLNDVDTDLIYPAQYLTSISRNGLGVNLFRRLRETEPSFVFNNPKYETAQILLANKNFGCGSSREHAVWSLVDAGVKVVIANSFADIFYNNSAKNGLLLVKLEESVVDMLLERASREDLELSVDLERQVVVFRDQDFSFDYDPFRKHCLLNGLEDLDYLLAHKQEIEQFRKIQDKHRFCSTIGDC